ncbi:maleylpyruvate isomerase family mycothiol-dependent enzyme [Streptomyces sp. SID10853]|uniref:maleylpyruvate isomerase family mycothiol-dependent enzyme n=1 Tax=Streptomyces sp. SID10853 TaxID=2706028 RepID=UPI0013C18E7F|nr:maleylpyruvate isomerase family mycothiol-dependent enzyme [Streptomyces sp. SID10853]NDZ83742.1 maleylpyruvate isomerase family mycothiol-dependent enzyme [Streptomyces sp. SID10853]
MNPLPIGTFISALDREGRLLATAAARAGTRAAVPTCPGWDVRDLLRHTGAVHRWATDFVTEGHTRFRPPSAAPRIDGDGLIDWFGAGHRSLVAALTAAPEDLDCLTFLPAATPLAFWARRQAHETAVHRMDAESALGTEPDPPDPEFAADGIDELLRGFHARSRSRVRTEGPRALRVRATDTGDVWTVHLSAEPPRAEHTGEGPADCELSGEAALLYATLWNRRPLSAVSVTGDAALAWFWRETSAV